MASNSGKARTRGKRKLTTIEEDQDTRTIKVGLHPNGDATQRVIVLGEPSMTEFIRLQSRAAELDRELPPAPIPDDPQNPTGEELMARAEAGREQQAFLFSEDMPYGKLFLEMIQTCSDEDVNAEELPVWALSVEASRRVLDFFKSLSDGPVAAALLDAIRQQGQSS